MPKFIKLSNIILNTTHIIQINIKPQKYYITSTNYDMDGIFLIGSGYVSPILNQLIICADKSPIDYKIVQIWIDKLE